MATEPMEHDPTEESGFNHGLTRPVDTRGGMKHAPTFSIIAMMDNGWCRDGETGRMYGQETNDDMDYMEETY